jgi:hypothetical protein
MKPMLWLKSNSRLLLILFVLVVISIPAVVPLFHSGFFVTDDGEWMIIRFSAFYQALADGQFPVRFLHRLNFDYGYPVITFLYPGFMYAAVPLHILKIGFVDAIKIILGGSLIATTVFTYLWLSHVFKKRIAAIAGAVVSLYLPYHLYDVYTRGSVGEIFALTFVPFILWMLERKNFFFISVGIALLLIAHNSLALLFLYALLRKTFSVKNIVFSFTLSIFLVAFFIIPAVFELSLTRFSQTVISDPTKYLADLSLIGFSTLLIFIVAGSLFIFQKKSQIVQHTVLGFFLLITFFAIGLSSAVSSFLWQFIPSSFIQFPFRLLSYLIISIAFLTAFIVSSSPQRMRQHIFIAVIVFISFLSSYQFMTPKEYMDKGEGYYSTNEATTTVQDEYLPKWITMKANHRPESKVEIIKGRSGSGDILVDLKAKGEISNIAYNNKEISFTVQVPEDDFVRVLINTIYWPGWNAFVDGKEVPIDYKNKKGIIEFTVPKGTHQVKASFGETPLRLFADIVSLVSFFVLLLVVFRFKHLK